MSDHFVNQPHPHLGPEQQSSSLRTMDAFEVTGGHKLAGSIDVRGAKNAALPVIATCLLSDQSCRYRNMPLLRDVQTQVKILNTLGIETSWRGRTVTARCVDTYNNTAPYELVKTMRAGVLVLGPLLAKRGQAKVSLPGGCVIGERPIDLHLRGLEALGARFTIEHGDIIGKAPRGGLRGAEVYLGGRFGSSVTATANVMMAACLAAGKTVIECAACEPEIVDLADCLRSMGAKIRGDGSPCVEITGVKRLRGAEHRVIPDRIEAATFLALGIMNRSPITVNGARPDHLMAFIHTLKDMGIEIKRAKNKLTVVPTPASRRWGPADLVTLPYPAFPTDCQAQTLTLASIASGASVITERIYPDRFMHAAELKRMGADIRVTDGQAVINGVDHLDSAEVMASDLRASAALVIAASAATGTSLIRRIYHIDRGYERIEERLSALGVRIRRVDAEG